MGDIEAQQVAVQIAHRAALRVLPMAWDWFSEEPSNTGDETALPVLRCLITSAGASEWLSSEFERFATATNVAAATNDTTDAAFAAARSARAATNVTNAVSAAARAATNAATAAHIAQSAFYDGTTFSDLSASGPGAIWEEIRRDAVYLEQGGDRLDGFVLWQGEMPKPIAQAEHDFKPRAVAEAPIWDFWLRFWELGKQGKAQPWELLLEIAEIPEEDWQAGPERIAELIAGIELEWLRKEVSTLKSELSETRQTHASALHRSHNQPPELVEEDVRAAKAVTLVWDVLGEAEFELEKEQPDPSKLKELSLKLWSAWKVVARYCGAKADKAIGASMKAIGAAGGVAIVDAVANNGRLREFAKQFLNYTGGG